MQVPVNTTITSIYVASSSSLKDIEAVARILVNDVLRIEMAEPNQGPFIFGSNSPTDALLYVKNKYGGNPQFREHMVSVYHNSRGQSFVVSRAELNSVV